MMASMLEACDTRAGSAAGLEQAAVRIGGRSALVFIVSDFHWPLDRLTAALDILSPACVTPLVLWDPAEVEPPADGGLLFLRDVESGAARTLWMRPKLRSEWRARVAQRRAELDRVCAARDVRPFYVVGEFEGDALSQYFLEAAA
jgi:hypothetical protein